MLFVTISCLLVFYFLCGCGKDLVNNEKQYTNTENNEVISENESIIKDFKCFSQEAKIEKTVIYQDSNVVITANDLVRDELFVEHLNLTIENVSDTTITAEFNLGSRDCYYAVNGYINERAGIMYMEENIPVGQKVDTELRIMPEDFYELGFEGIAEIQLSFLITVYGEEYATPAVTLKTSLYDSFDFEKDYIKEAVNGGLWDEYFVKEFDDDVILDEKGLKIYDAFYLEKEYGTKKNNPFYLGFVIENTSEEYRTLKIENEVIDPYEIFDVKNVNLMPGNKMLIKVSLSAFLKNGFDEVVGKEGIGTMSFDVNQRHGDKIEEYISSTEIVYDKNIKVNEVHGVEVYRGNGLVIEQLPVIKIRNTIAIIPLKFTNVGNKDICVSAQNTNGTTNDMENGEINWDNLRAILHKGNKTIFSVSHSGVDIDKAQSFETSLMIDNSQSVKLELVY